MSKFKSDKKYADVLTVLLVIIIIAIIGMLGYFGYKIINKKSIEDTATKKIDEFKRNIPSKESVAVEDGEPTDISSIIDNSQEQQPAQKKASKKTYLDGYEIKGIINISKIKCNYPILEEVTVESLSKAVGILDIQSCPEVAYSGKDLNIPGTNTLILGHNYRNGLFFSNNDKLAVGDKIDITDQTGTKITYTIYEMYYTTPNDVKFMQRELDKNTREITLQTCNSDSSQRLIIQAKDN